MFACLLTCLLACLACLLACLHSWLLDWLVGWLVSWLVVLCFYLLGLLALLCFVGLRGSVARELNTRNSTKRRLTAPFGWVSGVQLTRPQLVILRLVYLLTCLLVCFLVLACLLRLLVDRLVCLACLFYLACLICLVCEPDLLGLLDFLCCEAARTLALDFRLSSIFF